MKGARFLPKDNTAKAVLLLSALFFVFAKWYPIINTFLLSLKEATFFSESWIGLHNYKKLFFEQSFQCRFLHPFYRSHRGCRNCLEVHVSDLGNRSLQSGVGCY